MKHSGAPSPGRTRMPAGPDDARRSRGLRVTAAARLLSVPGGDMTCCRRIRAGGRDEDCLTVVAEFLDALPDICERTVAAVLLRAREVGARVPAPGELLDARHVDHPVVQEGVQLRHVAGDECSVR